MRARSGRRSRPACARARRTACALRRRRWIPLRPGSWPRQGIGEFGAVAALLLAFASSVAWGAGDFLGGLKSRQHPVLVVLLVAQLTGLLLIAGYVAIRADGPPGGELALWAPLSGIAGAVGLAAFYRALAIGNMGVVAPISATAAVVPLVVGVAGGDRPGKLQYAGIALALVGVVLAAREEVGGRPGGTARGAGLALLSALGFGLFFVCMDR